MRDSIKTFTAYVAEHKQSFSTGAIAVIGLAVIVGLFIYNQPHHPEITYQPSKACDLLTPAKAMDALGDKVISTEANNPVVSGDTATSKCGYTDENADKNAMAEITLAVRSAINDAGIAQNKSDFLAAKKTVTHVQVVNGLGEQAYFNEDTGLLYALKGKLSIILSYGTGQTPDSKPATDVVELAHKIIGR